MQTRLVITLLAAATLAACGSDSGPKPEAQNIPLAGEQSQQVTPGATKPAAPVVKGAFVPAAVRPKTRSGKGPAVVLLPDTGNGRTTDANREAGKLSKLGVAALVVAGPPDAPKDAAAFDLAVSEALAAVHHLKKQPGVDPNRIGIVGEGVGAHIGAVAIGREPSAISAAALADIGGIVVPSPTFAPDRWLRRATGLKVLFQRDLAKRAMTPAEVKKLMVVSPPGTLMEQYKDLGDSAELSRDTWIKRQLLIG